MHGGRGDRTSRRRSPQALFKAVVRSHETHVWVITRSLLVWDTLPGASELELSKGPGDGRNESMAGCWDFMPAALVAVIFKLCGTCITCEHKTKWWISVCANDALLRPFQWEAVFFQG